MAVTLYSNSFIRFQQFEIQYVFYISPNNRAISFLKILGFVVHAEGCHMYPWFFKLSIIILNPLFILLKNVLQKKNIFMPGKKWNVVDEMIIHVKPIFLLFFTYNAKFFSANSNVHWEGGHLSKDFTSLKFRV